MSRMAAVSFGEASLLDDFFWLRKSALLWLRLLVPHADEHAVTCAPGRKTTPRACSENVGFEPEADIPRSCMP
jgi:hypothetical protein